MIWPLAALAWVQAGQPHLSPIVDRPYHFVAEETRTVAGTPRRFMAERRIIFRRNGDALVAEVTLERLTTDAPAEVARRFLTGSGGLKGRTVRFRLAPDGSVANIDDQEAVWAAMVAGIGAMTGQATHPGARSSLSRDPATAVAGLPPERRRAVIASIVAGLFVDPATLPALGSRAVRVTGRTLTGEPVVLGGEEAVDVVPDGGLRLVTRVANAQVRLIRTRIVDPTTGLLISEEETTSFLDGDNVLGTQSSKHILTLVS